MIKQPKDFLAGAFFLLVGALFFYLSLSFKFGEALNMGPAYFPRVTSVIMMAFGSVLFGRSFTGSASEWEPVVLRAPVFVLGGVLLFGILLRPAGLVPAILAMVLTGAIGTSELSWRAAATLACCLALGSVIVFVYLLGQPIPAIGHWFV